MNIRSFVCSVLFLFASAASLAVEQYTYRETAGSKKTSYVWSLEAEQEVVVKSIYEKAEYLNICKKDGQTLRWEVKRKDRAITAVREGDFVIIDGNEGENTVNRRLKFGDRLWYQPLSFSLRSLVKSNKKSVVFSTVRPDKIELIELKAVKDKIETIAIGKESFKTQKIIVKPTGLFSFAWHATYWFRLEDGLFLRYQSVHGPPGTAETIIEIQP